MQLPVARKVEEEVFDSPRCHYEPEDPETEIREVIEETSE
jgi:hypothetical protein